MSEVMVRIDHARALGMCSRGVRTWLVSHGLSYREMLTSGIPVEKIEAIDDQLGLMVAAMAREDQERG